ncbi:uncharacterized protein G2W53_010333 [Senna tora]|uniref:Uncharacterized protein n=1 Tax=Senna tora TaxID=362788 RepID=A0A834X021_9FABA|nr:uncharacterized protein G2W53_010333 [Senna tora]
MQGVSSHGKTQFELKIAIDSKKIKKYKFKRVVAQVSQTGRFALCLGIRVDLMLERDSGWNERHFELKIAIDSQNIKKYKFKRVVAEVNQTDPFALYFGIRMDLMLEWDS